jgi:hypothetical protein
MDDQDLTRQIELYKELSEKNKGINLSALMINALQQRQDNKLTTKEKSHAYMVSFMLPPFGLIYVIKFLFSDKGDSKKAALICIILTLLSFILFTVALKAILSGSGVTLNQIEQIKPQDIYQLAQ